MKAIVYTTYGSPDVLQLKEVERPVLGDNEVLIKVQAASVNAADWHLMRGDPLLVRLTFGLLKPKHQILGADVAGRVEAVGAGVSQFQPGDEVFGELSSSGWGGFAEYVCAAEKALALKPERLTFEQAAAAPLAAVTALQGLRDKGRIQPGQKVLVNGASGGVGTFAVQIAKSFGAHVTAVCSTRNLEQIRLLGADRVIDYTHEDVTKGEPQYDLIVDAAAYRSVLDYQRVLVPGGIYVLIGGSMARLSQLLLLEPWISWTGSRKVTNLMMQSSHPDLIFIKELIESGKVTPVIDRRYPLEEAAEALRYVEQGHTQGKVILTVGPNSQS